MSSRISTLRACMAQHNVEVALFTSIHNINYYADFVYCSFGRPYGLVVMHDSHTTVSANIDGGQPWRQSLADNIVYTDWQRDNYFRVLRKLIDGKVRVGIEYGHITLERREKLAQFLPDAEFMDLGVPTMQLRMIKSAEEHALIRQGARISDIGAAACVEAITSVKGRRSMKWPCIRPRPWCGRLPRLIPTLN